MRGSVRLITATVAGRATTGVRSARGSSTVRFVEKISLSGNKPVAGSTGTALAGPSRRPRYGDEWRGDAACRDLDTELFFENGLTEPALAQQALAKKICAECPVRVECLEFALQTNQQFGIWGGANEDERREIRRARRRAARRAAAAQSAQTSAA